MKYIRCISYLIIVMLAAAWARADIMGSIRGSVKDADGKPLEKVTITIQATGDRPNKYSSTTNSKGEFVHIGIQSGDYRVTPSKDGYIAVDYGYVDLHIAPSDKPAEVTFKMAPAQKAAAAQKPAESPAHSEAQKGVALLDQGKYDEAIAIFQKALETDPADAAIHYNLGVAFERKEQIADARTQYQEAIKSNPALGEAYLALGNGYLHDQNFDVAAPLLTKAAELMPSNYSAAYNLGACLANAGKYPDAEAAFRKAVAISPNEPIAHYQLAMSLLGQSKNAEAKAEFQKYLELKPDAADRKDIEELLKSMQ